MHIFGVLYNHGRRKEMEKEKKYEKYTEDALNALSEIIYGAEDLKVKISAAKEILNITTSKNKKEEASFPTVIIKGDVKD